MEEKKILKHNEWNPWQKEVKRNLILRKKNWNNTIATVCWWMGCYYKKKVDVKENKKNIQLNFSIKNIHVQKKCLIRSENEREKNSRVDVFVSSYLKWKKTIFTIENIKFRVFFLSLSLSWKTLWLGDDKWRWWWWCWCVHFNRWLSCDNYSWLKEKKINNQIIR